jgi:hypothetical protein
LPQAAGADSSKALPATGNDETARRRVGKAVEIHHQHHGDGAKPIDIASKAI